MSTYKTPTERSEIKKKMRTSTRSFGSGKREGHDASSFYDRFSEPVISNDEQINHCSVPNTFWHADSRDLSFIGSNSVALVVTSPPYFVGKEYELGIANGSPRTYIEYLEMLREVFAECYRVLEPGGRIAVNVANLGRKPYRSLSADVSTILQDELGFLLRGEIIWIKGKGANGSCAWGSYGSATNPVLRDVTERIVVASKGRFSRAIDKRRRESMGLPFRDTISPEDFRTWTLDTWYVAPASAKRLGHPAPFPLELPSRLIQLFTYESDVVLDPFGGSAQTVIAALETGRQFIYVDSEEEYVDLARSRVRDWKSYQPRG
ncbi:site-specific DNA-methyltransferase (adenine-specific) [Ferrithrix thermotolerans DSM 19514]|uniref:Methyltransferase n=1 Tax=Ferrithrix thermotolerans DSM 19514 TaxID=1121881 RepID=A0A1M4XKN1_9ACTN|nr:site-specific DNA-methyltransferase [Ferrithrix thermotolerans]SHE93823.1 site-specific DNA-methyltransferase (adenine-specific) [Ferrithrix thermotolerans DSM 19514]